MISCNISRGRITAVCLACARIVRDRKGIARSSPFLRIPAGRNGWRCRPGKGKRIPRDRIVRRNRLSAVRIVRAGCDGHTLSRHDSCLYRGESPPARLNMPAASTSRTNFSFVFIKNPPQAFQRRPPCGHGTLFISIHAIVVPSYAIIHYAFFMHLPISKGNPISRAPSPAPSFCPIKNPRLRAGS